MLPDIKWLLLLKKTLNLISFPLFGIKENMNKKWALNNVIQ